MSDVPVATASAGQGARAPVPVSPQSRLGRMLRRAGIGLGLVVLAGGSGYAALRLRHPVVANAHGREIGMILGHGGALYYSEVWWDKGCGEGGEVPSGGKKGDCPTRGRTLRLRAGETRQVAEIPLHSVVATDTALVTQFLQIFPLDGSGATIAPSSGGIAKGHAADMDGIYWIDGRSCEVRHAGLGSKVEAWRIAKPEHGCPVRVDVDGDSVYFTVEGEGAGLYVTSKSGRDERSSRLDDGEPWPANVAFDEGYVYWVKDIDRFWQREIRRVPKRGGEPEVVAKAEGPVWYLLVLGNSLYWRGGAKGFDVMTVPRSGGEPASIFVGFEPVNGIACDGEHVFAATPTRIIQAAP